MIIIIIIIIIGDQLVTWAHGRHCCCLLSHLQELLHLVILLLQLLYLCLPVVLTQPLPGLACRQPQDWQGWHIIVACLMSDIHQHSGGYLQQVVRSVRVAKQCGLSSLHSRQAHLPLKQDCSPTRPPCPSEPSQ